MSEDRTAEFFNIASSLSNSSIPTSSSSYGHHKDYEKEALLRGTVSSSYRQPSQQTSGPNSGQNDKSDGNMSGMSTLKREAYAELRSFHVTAADISRDIAVTSNMLQELTQLVHRRNLFMDDSDRVNFLVMNIKENVENLNGRLDDVAEVIAKQKRRLGNSSQAGQEASNLVGQLKEEFVKATKGFKSILQQRSDAIKEKKDRKMQVFGGSSTSSQDQTVGLMALGTKPPLYNKNSKLSGPGANLLPSLDLTSSLMDDMQTQIPAGESTSSASQLPRPKGVSSDMLYNKMTSNSGLHFRANTASSNKPLTPFEIQQQEQQQSLSDQQSLQLIPDHNYLRQRADAMTQVESNIVELGTIFNKLAVMVSEHSEMVQRVEDNVDDANQNINLSLNTLTDTLMQLQTNRMLFMKVFAVLVVFIILFISFFA